MTFNDFYWQASPTWFLRVYLELIFGCSIATETRSHRTQLHYIVPPPILVLPVDDGVYHALHVRRRHQGYADVAGRITNGAFHGRVLEPHHCLAEGFCARVLHTFRDL